MKELLNRDLMNVQTRDPRDFLERAKATEGAVLLTNSEPDFGISIHRARQDPLRLRRGGLLRPQGHRGLRDPGHRGGVLHR